MGAGGTPNNSAIKCVQISSVPTAPFLSQDATWYTSLLNLDSAAVWIPFAGGCDFADFAFQMSIRSTSTSTAYTINVSEKKTTHSFRQAGSVLVLDLFKVGDAWSVPCYLDIIVTKIL